MLPQFDQIIKLWGISCEIEGVKDFRLQLQKYFDLIVMSCRICTIITRSFFTRHVIATTVTEAVSQAYEDLHKSPKVVGKHIQLRTTATEFLALGMLSI